MGNNKNDFVLDSKGHCFFCLDKIFAVKHEQDSGPQTFPEYSVHYLSRYLKMDIRKVFNDREQIPSHLLAKVESSRLNVGLCAECVCLIEQFAENYRELEKAEMKLKSCLRLIHGKFLDTSGTTGKIEEIKKLTKEEPHIIAGSTGELEIMEVLREEAYHKSRQKLRTGVLQVHLQNLTRKQITTEKLKFKTIASQQQEIVLPASTSTGRSSKSQLGADETNIKIELDTSDAYIPSENDNGDCGYSAHSNSYDEAINDKVKQNKMLKVEKHNDDDPIKKPQFKKITLKVQFISKPKLRKSFSSINPETGKHKCVICSMEFAYLQGFLRHYKSVHLKVRFKCDTCGKGFSRREDCNYHQRSVHAGVRYACQVCNKSYTLEGSLRKHLRGMGCQKKQDFKSTTEKL